MRVLYVDTLFLLNALVDYLLLLAAARLSGEPLRRLRFGMGAVLGGIYAAGTLFPGLAFLRHPLCRGASCLLMLVTAYGGSRRLLRQGVLFVALTCAFGGGTIALGLLNGRGLMLGPGMLYSKLDVKTLLFSAAVCYAVITAALQRVGRHTAASGELVPVRLWLGERQVELTALVDTGNTLADPISGQPAMVAEGEALLPLFPRGCQSVVRALSDPVEALQRLGAGKWSGRFRLLPYRAIGVGRGLLLAVRVDRWTLDGEERGPLLVALSPTPVSDGGAYRALISPMDGKEGMG